MSCFRYASFMIGLPLSGVALAAPDQHDVLTTIADRFLSVSSSWAPIISGYAANLFWSLVLISMTWTFGFMALKQADIGEFFAEFIRFIIFTGFYFWLLTNGPKFAMSIIDSLRQIGGEASGMGHVLKPSDPVYIGFDIVSKSSDSISLTNPIDSIAIVLVSIAILICLAVVAANVLLALITAWILAYAGIFILGFGGSKWTSDAAINYFRAVLGTGLKLMTITLLVGIAMSVMDGFYKDLSEGADLNELQVILVLAFVLAMIVHSVPDIVAGLVPGGNVGSAGSSFSAGAVVGAAATAAAVGIAGTKMMGRAAMGTAMGAMGGVSAVKAAFEKAKEYESSSGGMSLMQTKGGSAFDNRGGDKGSGGASFGSQRQGTAPPSPGQNKSGLGGNKSTSALGKAGRVAAGTGANLAKGMLDTAKDKVGEKISNTTGGKIAATIRTGQTDASSGSGFGRDSIGGGFKRFVPEDTSIHRRIVPDMSWGYKEGGADALNDYERENAQTAYGRWQGHSSRSEDEKNMSFGDYVDLFQKNCKENG